MHVCVGRRSDDLGILYAESEISTRLSVMQEDRGHMVSCHRWITFHNLRLGNDWKASYSWAVRCAAQYMEGHENKGFNRLLCGDIIM